MDSGYRIVVSPSATEQLVKHAFFVANVNEDDANRLVHSFQACCTTLKSNPLRCPWLRAPSIPGNTYRFLMFEKRYMLIYQVKDNTIYIDYVIDCWQDYQWLIHS